MSALRALPRFFFLALCAGCAVLPPLTPAGPAERDAIAARCRELFPSHPWQLSHGILYTAPGGRTGAMLGVLRVDPAARAVICNLLSPEGWLLVDAEACGAKTVVRRAVPPFDDPAFMRGLLEDIGLVFLAPEGPCREAGADRAGARLCRYPLAGGGLTEALLLPAGGWEIRRYDRAGRLVRRAELPPAEPKGMPLTMHLSAPGPLGYQMDFKLLAADPAPPVPADTACQGQDP
jgi:hypothetical protein